MTAVALTPSVSDDGGTTGPLVLALEAAWQAMRDRHPEIAPAVIVVASGTMGGITPRWGHFAAARWRRAGDDGGELAEILVSGEGLVRGAELVLATLLHEGAHALAHARGVKDTSRQGRWHNRRYRQLAEELGLVVTQVENIGWSGTVLAADTVIAYGPELRAIAAALVIYRRPEGGREERVTGGTGSGGEEGSEGSDGEPTRRGAGSVTCPCGRRIRVARAVLEVGSISCGLCGGDFAPERAEHGIDEEAA